MLKTPLTGVDANTSFTVAFGGAHAILSCSITLPPSEFGVHARFRNGNIKLDAPIYGPREFRSVTHICRSRGCSSEMIGAFTVQYFDKPGSGKVVREERRTFEYTGFGWHFQADEVR
jgi:hypothetical protein